MYHTYILTPLIFKNCKQDILIDLLGTVGTSTNVFLNTYLLTLLRYLHIIIHTYLFSKLQTRNSDQLSKNIPVPTVPEVDQNLLFAISKERPSKEQATDTKSTP